MSNFTLVNNVKVGQEVGVQNGYGRGHVSFGYKVVKVTASGQVVVEHTTAKNALMTGPLTKRFDAGGYEMGSVDSKYHKDRLVLDVEVVKERQAAQQRAQIAADAIRRVKVEDSRGTYSKDTLQSQIEELKTLLATAEAAVKAI